MKKPCHMPSQIYLFQNSVRKLASRQHVGSWFEWVPFGIDRDLVDSFEPRNVHRDLPRIRETIAFHAVGGDKLASLPADSKIDLSKVRGGISGQNGGTI